MPNFDKKTKKILEDSEVIAPKDKNKELDLEKQREQTVKELAKELGDVPLRHIEFIQAWLKHGSATKAYMQVYNQQDKTIAGASAYPLTKKYRPIIRSILLEKLGATDSYFINGIMELTKANKHFYTKDGGIKELPDNKTRTRAYKLLGDVLEFLKDPQTMANQTNIGSVVIVKDKEKGTFRVGGNEEEAEVVEN